MPSNTPSDSAHLLRLLPSADSVLQGKAAGHVGKSVRRERLTELVRLAIADVRDRIRRGEITLNGVEEQVTREQLLKETESSLIANWERSRNQSLRRVINATGVVIHTNLGRAPLSEGARKAMFEEASRYCNLEYDLSTGKRGTRGARAERMIAELTGAEDAVLVNNCAAATLLVLMSLSSGGEAVVSRGELVEIGGEFRVPDVMAQSGTAMREVGTTNRTKLSDYEEAITENTKLLLRVHTSNFRVVGFTESPSISELATLAKKRNVILFEDAGSGALADMSDHGLKDEPLIRRSIADGADIVTFSGDKLLGGIQAGIIIGRRDLIERIRRHPLYRAFRVEKLVYAGIQGTLESFERGTEFQDIPVLRMLSATKEDISARTNSLLQKLRVRVNGKISVEIAEERSAVGGGSAPDVEPETVVLTLCHSSKSANEIESYLRSADPPVIARIVDENVLIDLRTVFEDEEEELISAIVSATT